MLRCCVRYGIGLVGRIGRLPLVTLSLSSSSSRITVRPPLSHTHSTSISLSNHSNPITARKRNLRRGHLAVSSSSSKAMTTTTTTSSVKDPPVANKVKHELELFGDVRVDNYYWLRDDSRSDPQVLSYLQEENAYTDFLMSGGVLSVIFSFSFFLFSFI